MIKQKKTNDFRRASLLFPSFPSLNLFFDVALVKKKDLKKESNKPEIVSIKAPFSDLQFFLRNDIHNEID